MLARLVLVLLVAGPGVLGQGDQRPECALWSKLENKTVPLQNQGHANCTTNMDCTGFNCVGVYQVRHRHFVVTTYTAISGNLVLLSRMRGMLKLYLGSSLHYVIFIK